MLKELYDTRNVQDAKSVGEFWAFATAILPFVNEVNPTAAEALYTRTWLLDFTGDYVADKRLIESTYSKLGVGIGKGLITCEGIGDLHYSSTVVSAGTCYTTTCSENEYVSSNICTPCPLGTNNTAGDDRLGENTTCISTTPPPAVPMVPPPPNATAVPPPQTISSALIDYENSASRYSASSALIVSILMWFGC